MAAMVPVCVRTGGSWVTLSNGIEKYRGGTRRLLSIPKDSNYEQLLHRVYDCLGIDPTQFNVKLRSSFVDSETGDVMYLDIGNDYEVEAFVYSIVVTDSRKVPPLYVTTERVVVEDHGVTYTPHLQDDIQEVHVQPFVSSFGSNQFNDEQCTEPVYYGGFTTCQDTEQPVQHEVIDNTIRTPCRNYCDEETDTRTNMGYGMSQRSRFMPCEGDIGGPSNTRSLPAIPPSYSRPQDAFSSSMTSVITVGQIFNSKKDLRDTLGMMALRENFQFKVCKSSTDRFEAKCVVDGCKWRVRATSTDGNGVYWSVKRIEPTHTCRSDQLQPGHRQANSRFIAEHVVNKFQDPSRIYTPTNIQDDIQQEFGVRVSYRKAWLAREEARNLACGDPTESFKLLPQFCHVLESSNPGTITHIHTDEDDNFLYFFMAIGACIRGFLSSMRPVIAVDGTFLKGTYRGTMFVAAAIDGNDQIYPLAFGVGDSENDASWEWFLSKLKDALGPVVDLVFVSDRHGSIISGIRKVFPESYHGFCSYHIEGNLKAKYKFKHRSKCTFLMGYYVAAKAYTFSEFEEHMDKLRSVHLDAANYLEHEVGFHRWARCHFPVRRYDMMTTNIAESINALLKDARVLPIVALLDWIRSVLQRWFYERREEAAKFDGDTLTEAATTKVRNEDAQSLTLSVFPVSRFEFEVKGRGEDVVVDLSTRTCQCRRFDLQQLPCAHALAAIRHVRGQYGEFCSPYYKNGTLLAAYAEEIHAVGDETFWVVPHEVRSTVVKPPVCRVPSGRPRNLRIPSTGKYVIKPFM